MNPLEIAEFKQDWQKDQAVKIIKICEEAAPDGVWDRKGGMPYFILKGKNILGFWPAKKWVSVFVMDVAKLNSSIFTPGERKKDATIHVTQDFKDWDELQKIVKASIKNQT
jgi:hypothetical protein